jgi:hypothetical protein
VETSRLVNKCIYCGSLQQLTDEHVVPLGLSGEKKLLNASCLECNKITSAIEEHVQRVYLIKVRSALKTRTRRPKERRYEFPVTFYKGDKSKITLQRHVDDHPTIAVFPEFLPPGFVRLPPDTDDHGGLSLVGIISVQMGGPNFEEFAKSLRVEEITAFDQEVTLQPFLFARFLAKVAYCVAVWQYGLDCFEDIYVLPAIMGKIDSKLGRWVGTIPFGEGTLGTEGAHLTNTSIARSENAIRNRSVLVRIKLFAVFNTPEYAIVVGRLKEDCVPLS